MPTACVAHVGSSAWERLPEALGLLRGRLPAISAALALGGVLFRSHRIAITPSRRATEPQHSSHGLVIGKAYPRAWWPRAISMDFLPSGEPQ